MEETKLYVIKNKDYGYFVDEKFIQGLVLPAFSDNLQDSEIFKNKVGLKRFECYGEPVEVKLREK